MATPFKNAQGRRSFWVVVLTYLLDVLGYSIVFPILAPLLLDPNLHYFSADATLTFKTTILGWLFASFGITQFIGSPINGALADQFGRYKIFLLTIGVSIIGYAICALGVYLESLSWLFTGRLIAGFCSGNIGLAQSAVADVSTERGRAHAFGILLGSGSLGFIIGPVIGGKLANPAWMHGASAFVFGAIAALINLLFVIFFFRETFKPKKEAASLAFGTLFKDIAVTFRHPKLAPILSTSLCYCVGWAAWLTFSPTFLVQRFGISASTIGEFYAYNALCWFFFTTFVNKELVERWDLRHIILPGLLTAAIGVGLYPLMPRLWIYWVWIPITMCGGALSFVNLSTLISHRANKQIQGKAMGANSSMWSLGQALAPIIAGPLAGWNLYSPLLVGGGCILVGFFYFLFGRGR